MLYTTSSSSQLKHHSEIYLSVPHANSEISLEHVTYEIKAAMRKLMKLSAHVSVSCDPSIRLLMQTADAQYYSKLLQNFRSA